MNKSLKNLLVVLLGIQLAMPSVASATILSAVKNELGHFATLTKNQWTQEAPVMNQAFDQCPLHRVANRVGYVAIAGLCLVGCKYAWNKFIRWVYPRLQRKVVTYTTSESSQSLGN